MIVLDFITGILSAIYNRELESRACLKGIIKKSCYFLLVIVAHELDTLVPNIIIDVPASNNAPIVLHSIFSFKYIL